MKAGAFAERLNHCVLAFLQNKGPKLYMAGFIDAVHVAEGSREEISPADRIEAARYFQRVFRRRVEFRSVVADDIVFFTADRAGFDLEDQLTLCETGEQLLGDVEVLGEREVAPVE